MQNVLAITIVTIGGVFLALTVVIVINKAWREGRDGYRRRRRRELEPQVLAFAHGDHPSIIAALGGQPTGADRGVLEQVLLDYVERVRGIERERLGTALDELGYVAGWLAQLNSPRWWRRAEASEKLGLAGAKRATDELVRVLEDESSEVRMRAAKALGTLGGTASARSLIHALNEPNRWSTIRIADILTAMGREVIDDLLEAFNTMSLPGRLAALDIVGRIRPLRAESWLFGRLEDDEANIRARACHALGSIGDPNCGPQLLKALGDPAWPVRAMAAKAIGRVRYHEGIDGLCVALRDPEWWVRTNAAESLRGLGRRGLAALEEMLDDQDTYARHQAVLMLQETGVVDERVGHLGRAEGPDREAAEKLLRKLIAAGQTGRLNELACEHPDLRVREALRGILEVPA